MVREGLRERTTRLFVGLGILVWVLGGLPALGASLPDAPPAALRGLVGFYEDDGGRLLLRERDGALEALYEPGGGKERPFGVPKPRSLRPLGGDRYALAPGLTGAAGEILTATRDASGRGIRCRVGRRIFRRHFFPEELGKTFRILPRLPLGELRRRADRAVPPREAGDFLSPDLVELVRLDPSLVLDLRYATSNNIMGLSLYDQPRAFLQRPAAEAVVRVQRALVPLGLGLVIHDAYRPWRVTKMFWDATPPEQRDFVANPAKGSRHNRGCAVDLSLVDLATRRPLEMTSGFDEFSFRARPDYPGGTSRQRALRDLLRARMEAEGFTVFPDEWWHFDYRGWQSYPLLNVPLGDL